MEDLTGALTGKSYWPSYNSPYFKDIFNMSGSPANVKKFGDWFSYDKTPRALIFKRDHRYSIAFLHTYAGYYNYLVGFSLQMAS